MNYEERIPLNSLLAGNNQHSVGHAHGNGHGHGHGHTHSFRNPGIGTGTGTGRINSRPIQTSGLATEGSLDILEHLISIILQGNISYLEQLLRNEEVLDVIDMHDNKGFTPLHVACDRYDPDATRLLLQAGADPNIRDKYSRTALHWVVNGGCRCDICNTRRGKCTELLITAHVDTEIEDYEGETALFYAAHYAMSKPAAIMLENGADISRCAKGVSLGHLIVQKIPEVMVQLLDGSIAYDNTDNSKLRLDFGVLIEASKKEEEEDVVGEKSKKRPGIRDSKGKPRKETDLLSYMMNAAHPTARESLLTHPVTEAFLHLKWTYVRKWFWFTRIFYCLLTLFYTYFVFDLYVFTCPYYKTWAKTGSAIENTGNNDTDTEIKIEEFKCTHSFELYILAICIGAGGILMIVNQLYKFCSGPWNYMKTGMNFGWWILVTCIGLSITPPLGLELTEWQYPIAAFGLFYAWAMNLAHLNHLPYFGVYIEMLWKVLQKLFVVSTTFVSLFIAFALGFCLLFPEIGFFDEITKSIVKSVMMMLGDRDYPLIFNKLEENRLTLPYYAIPAHLFYFAFLFTFGVVLLNLLLGLAVSDIQELQRKAELSRVCRQIKEITVLETFAVGKCWSRCFTGCILCIISVRSRNGRYFSFSATDPGDKSLPKEIKCKFIPYMKSRPCLLHEKLRRSPVQGVNQQQRFIQTGTGRVLSSQFRSQENLDDILNDLRNRLEGLNPHGPAIFSRR